MQAKYRHQPPAQVSTQCLIFPFLVLQMSQLELVRGDKKIGFAPVPPIAQIVRVSEHEWPPEALHVQGLANHLNICIVCSIFGELIHHLGVC